jgi:hypothetical protein
MEALEELVSLIPDKPDYSVAAAGGGAFGGSFASYGSGGSDEDILLPVGVEIK